MLNPYYSNCHQLSVRTYLATGVFADNHINHKCANDFFAISDYVFDHVPSLLVDFLYLL
jgi:hypothetical protein